LLPAIGVKIWLGWRVVDNRTVGVPDMDVGIAVMVPAGSGVVVDSRILLDSGVEVTS
jgi:hypothetical protein